MTSSSDAAAQRPASAVAEQPLLRIRDLVPADVREILRRHPRSDFKRELVATMRAEAAAVPAGRFGLPVRCGLPRAVPVAPCDF